MTRGSGRYLLSGAACAFSFLATCANPAAAQDVVRLGNLKFAHYGAVSYMQQVCPKYNIKLEERVFAKGIDILPALVAGEVDLGASAVDAAIAGRAQGIKTYIVAGFAKGGARIVAAKDSGIGSIAALKGKKAGVPRGGTQEIMLLAELDKFGLTWSDKPGKDVQIVYLAYPDLNQALQAKNIDAMSQSEPYATQSISRGFGVEIIKPYDTAIGTPSRALVMTEALYNGKPEVAARVMKCFVEATKTFISQPEVAERYVRDVMFKGQVSHDDFAEAIGNSPYTYDITAEEVQITTDLMLKFGVGRMTAPPVAAEYVKLDLLKTAIENQGH